MLTLAAACAAAGETARAASSLNRAEQTIANFSFATQLGSGIYAINGRTVQIYRLPFSWEIRAATEDQTGVAILLPVTLGFYDFKVEDVLHTQLPRSIDTLSFAPALEVSRLLRHDWRISSFVQAGIGKERTSTAEVVIYAAALRAERNIEVRRFRLRYSAELLYAKTIYKDRPDDSMLRFQHGLEARSNLAQRFQGVPFDYGVYALNEWYLKRPAPTLTSVTTSIAPRQWELGVTFGTERTTHIWKLPLPRVGFGYRFGDGLSIFRLVFGAPF